MDRNKPYRAVFIESFRRKYQIAPFPITPTAMFGQCHKDVMRLSPKGGLATVGSDKNILAIGIVR